MVCKACRLHGCDMLKTSGLSRTVWLNRTGRMKGKQDEGQRACWAAQEHIVCSMAARRKRLVRLPHCRPASFKAVFMAAATAPHMPCSRHMCTHRTCDCRSAVGLESSRMKKVVHSSGLTPACCAAGLLAASMSSAYSCRESGVSPSACPAVAAAAAALPPAAAPADAEGAAVTVGWRHVRLAAKRHVRVTACAGRSGHGASCCASRGRLATTALLAARAGAHAATVAPGRRQLLLPTGPPESSG
ncbi:hypothetical protein ABPG75_002776 [Micractinium tetrahymenae]